MFGKKKIDNNNFEIEKLKNDYEQRLAEQKDRIFLLVEENKKLTGENRFYKDKEVNINSALTGAAEKATDIERTAKEKYNLEIARLKNFQAKWERYYNEFLRNYPPDKNIASAKDFGIKLKQILGFRHENADYDLLSESERILDQTGKLTEFSEAALSAKKFDPKKRIDNFLDGEGAFNMDEILNPKEELDLEKLCKELGLM